VTELPVIVFDINETLLDLDTLAPTFNVQRKCTSRIFWKTAEWISEFGKLHWLPGSGE
jgi:hypothetical protein